MASDEELQKAWRLLRDREIERGPREVVACSQIRDRGDFPHVIRTESPTIYETHRSRTHAVRLFLCRRKARVSHAILGRVIAPSATDETRVDRWLCAVRLVKTRPLATRLCDGGHVLVNGSSAKPSTKVRAGDRVEAFIADRERIVEVLRPIESRVGAAIAATCYVDHSPPVVREAVPTIKLVRGEGRPGKRLRRELERLRRATDA